METFHTFLFSSNDTSAIRNTEYMEVSVQRFEKRKIMKEMTETFVIILLM